MSKQHTNTLTPEQRRAEWEKLTPEQKQAKQEQYIAHLKQKEARREQQDVLNKELIKASTEGNIEEMRLLLSKGAYVDARQNRESCLQIAIGSGQIAAIKLLVENGAFLRDHKLLQLVDYERDTELVKHLCSIGAPYESLNMVNEKKLKSIGLTKKDFDNSDSLNVFRLTISNPSFHILAIKNSPRVSANLFKIVSGYGDELETSLLAETICKIAKIKYVSDIKAKLGIIPFSTPERNEEFMERSKYVACLLAAAGHLAEPNNIKTILELEDKVLNAYDKSVRKVMEVGAPKIIMDGILSHSSLIPAIHWAKQNPQELKQLIGEAKESPKIKTPAEPDKSHAQPADGVRSRVPSLHALAVKAVAKMVITSEIEVETESQDPKRKLDQADLNEKVAAKEEGDEKEAKKPRTGDEVSKSPQAKSDPMSWEATVSHKESNEKGLEKTRY